MAAISSKLKGKTILVVDDESELRKAIVYDIKRLGCHVLEASCGNEAIEIVKKNRIDAVISDVRMPNGTGVELLEQIRKLNPEIPVVLLITGFADISKEEVMSKGAHEILDKPIDRKKLISILENTLFKEGV